MSIRDSTHMHTHTHSHMHTHTHAHIHTHIDTHVDTHIHIHTHTQVYYFNRKTKEVQWEKPEVEGWVEWFDEHKDEL